MPLGPETVPKDLKEIQPRPSQVCNCDDIGFDTNGPWIIFSVPTSSSQGKSLGNPEQETYPPSGVLI